MRRYAIGLLGLVVLGWCGSSWGILAVPSKPGDWPQFRGPERTGVSKETGLLKKWPEAGPKLVWSAKGIGRGFSTVSVSDKYITTMGDREEGCFLVCLNRANGKILWDLKVGGKGGNYEGPRCTPTIDGDKVYGLGQFGDLVCVTLKTGKELWRLNIQQEFGGQSGGWNYTESPLVDGDKLLCTPGGKDSALVALNKQDGTVIWRGSLPNNEAAGYSSIVIAEIAGVKQYVQMLSGGLAGFEASSGKLLWRFGDNGDRYAGNTANIPTPIVMGDHIFAAVGYGRGGAVCKIKQAGSQFVAEEVFFNRDLMNKHGGVIKVGDFLYGDKDDSGLPWCAEASTGKIVWKKTKRTDGSGSAAMTYADGALYIRYQNGVMALVKEQQSGYEEISAFQIPDAHDSWPHPVVAGGKLYLREQDTLYCHDIKAK